MAKCVWAKEKEKERKVRLVSPRKHVEHKNSLGLYGEGYYSLHGGHTIGVKSG